MLDYLKLAAVLNTECVTLANDEYSLGLEIEAIERGSHCFESGLDDMRQHCQRLCAALDTLQLAFAECRYLAALEDMGPSV